MKRVTVHLNKDSRKSRTQDISMSGKSVEQLIKLWKDPHIDERESGAALQELVRRGVDPKTGTHVGVAAAKQSAENIGESSPG